MSDDNREIRVFATYDLTGDDPDVIRVEHQHGLTHDSLTLTRFEAGALMRRLQAVLAKRPAPREGGEGER